MNFYAYEFDRGDVDVIQTPPLVGLTLADSLFFDYAYAEYDDLSFGPDSLFVLISTNGGVSFDTVFADGDATLATAPATSQSFLPDPTEWQTCRVGLPGTVVGSAVIIAFVGINGYGNNLYLDNVFVGVLPAIDLQAVDVLSPAEGSKQRGTVSPSAVFRNAGTADQTSVPIRFQILNPANSIIYNNTSTVSSFSAGSIDTAEFPDFLMPGTPGVYTVRAIVGMPGDEYTGNDTVVTTFYRPVDLSGTLTVGSGGQIPTLRAAIDSLNRNDVGGPLTLQLISNTYIESSPLTIQQLDGASPTATVTIRPAPGVSPTIYVEGTEEEPYAIGLIGTKYITFDGTGSSFASAAGGMTIIAEGDYGTTGIYIAGVPGASSGNVTIQDISIRTAADSLTSSSGYYGIFINGVSSAQKDSNVIISGCDITLHGQAGIASQNVHGLVIENTIVHDWVQRSGFADLRGIWLGLGTTQAAVQGNVIRNIRTHVNGWWAFGIQNGGGANSGLLCANNMITGVGSSGAGGDQNITAGIISTSIFNAQDKYLFNSVSLYGTDSSSSSASRISGFEFTSTPPAEMRLGNNIVSNTWALAGSGTNNKAYGVYYPAATWLASDTSNHNDWYTPGGAGSVGFFNGANRLTLANWQSATTQDGASISSDPLFVDGNNLHISVGSSPVSNAGTSIALVAADIDGDARSGVPDIGADEFSSSHVTVSVPTSPGWNMISNPVVRTAGNDSVRQLYLNAVFPYAFGFQNPAGYQQSPTLQSGFGYWEKFNIAEINYIGGDLLLEDTVNVQIGWNMIGSISTIADTGAIISIPPGIRASQWFGYNGGYFPADSLRPGCGYWVKANAAGLFILNPSP